MSVGGIDSRQRSKPSSAYWSMASALGGTPNTPREIVERSRPASSAAAHSWGSRSVIPRRPWIGIQPSQYSTTWRNVIGPPAPPITIGGYGVLTGLGQLHDGVKRTNSPSNDASSLVHSSCMASTFSRMMERRRDGSTPWFAISSMFHPTPMPMESRPSESRSREAIVLASTIGSCWATSEMPVPSRSRSVADAAAVSATYGSSVRLYSSGRGAPPGHGVARSVGMWVCSVTHSDSKPRCSSSTARSSGRIDRSVGKRRAPMCIVDDTTTAPGASGQAHERARARNIPQGAAVSAPCGMSVVPDRRSYARPPDGGRARWRA